MTGIIINNHDGKVNDNQASAWFGLTGLSLKEEGAPESLDVGFY